MGSQSSPEAFDSGVGQVSGSCLCWPPIGGSPCEGCKQTISTKNARSVPFKADGYWRFQYVACPFCLDLYEEVPPPSRPACVRYRWLSGLKAEVRADFGLQLPRGLGLDDIGW